MNELKIIEEKLINYFNKDKKIGTLNKKLEVLKKQVSEISLKLKNADVDIPEEEFSISYEERVQTSSTNCSYAEKALMRITDRLLDEKAWKKNQISEIEQTLRNIEVDNIVVDDVLNNLDQQDYEFLKEKYKHHRKDWQVGMKFNISQCAATKRKNKLLNSLIKFL